MAQIPLFSVSSPSYGKGRPEASRALCQMLTGPWVAHCDHQPGATGGQTGITPSRLCLHRHPGPMPESWAGL